MRKVLLLLVVLSFLTPALLLAQDPPKAEAHVWADVFGGKDGVVLYPQYGWSAETRIGKWNGFGFVETAPHEPHFTNHLVIFTPGKQKAFSVHTETGGRIADFEPVPGKTIPPAGFFQVGPRLNLHEAMPRVKKGMSYLFVAALPEFKGIRTNNFLMAGSTNKFPITESIGLSVEGYRRFFEGPDYAEYWLLIHPKATGPLSFSVFVLHSGDRVWTGFGGRFSVF
jgi:hypothetical protein